MLRMYSVFLIVLCVLFSKAALAAEMPYHAISCTSDANWPSFMRDGQLSGLSPLSGKIEKPKILWSHFIGSRVTLLELNFENGNLVLDLPEHNISLIDGDIAKYYRNWNIYGPYYDLDQTGNFTQFSSNSLEANYYKIGNFFPDIPGLQKIEWLYEIPNPVGFYVRKDGGWHPKWQIESPVHTGGAANRNVIVDDFDGDGRLEAAGLWWHKLMTVDIESGEVKQVASFYNEGSYSGRGYGWLGSYDFDGDGKKEIVLLGDTENHLNVIGWQDGKMVKLWGRLIESGIAQKKTIVVPGIEPLQDIDGNGIPEIVLSVFNYDYGSDKIGDGAWHVIALDAITGKLKLDIKEQFLSGLADITGDGISELLTTATSGERIEEPGRLRIYSFKNQQLATAWESPHSTSFVRRNLNKLPLNVNTCSPDGWKNLLYGSISQKGKHVFVTERTVSKNENVIEATFWQADSVGQIKVIGTLKAPYLEVLAFSEKNDTRNGQILVRTDVPKAKSAKLVADGLKANTVHSFIKGVIPGSPAVGVLKPGDPSTVVVEAGCGKVIEAFQPSLKSDTKTIWRVTGHSSINNIHMANDRSVLLADLNGDSNLETVFASKNDMGDGRLVALKSDGTELWHHDFQGIPCGKLGYVSPGMGGWVAGNFTSRDHLDLFVTVQRGTGHTGQEGYMLSGIDGTLIWHRTEGGSTPYGPFGVGGEWMLVGDYDGDGLDDIYSNFPMSIYVMRGSDGKTLLDKFVQHLFSPVVAYNGFIAIGDYRNSGNIEIFYGVPPVGFSLLNKNAELVWNNPDIVSSTRPAMGDICGDGKLGFIQTSENHLRLIDAISGSAIWSIEGVGGYVPPVLVDVTGDGIPEIIVVTCSKLQAVTCLDGKPELLWELQFSKHLGTPAIALIGGDLQIVVICADGYVYGIGNHNE